MLVTLIKKVNATTFRNNKTGEDISVVTNYGAFVSIYVCMLGENFNQSITIDGSVIGDATVLRDCEAHTVVLEKVVTRKKDGQGYNTNLWLRCIGTDTEVMKYLHKNGKFTSGKDQSWSEAWGEVVPRKEKTEENSEDTPAGMPDLAAAMQRMHNKS